MKKIVVFVMVLFMLNMGIVYAGNGEGGGKSPLKLESSTPESGTKNVKLNANIELVFSNNVVNMKVIENNKTCFKLLDSNDNEIAIDVIMGDDQIDPTIKNDVKIIPVDELAIDESYYLIISGDMTAKNGLKMKTDTIVEFSTVTSGKSSTMLILIIILVGVVLVAVVIVARKKFNSKT